MPAALQSLIDDTNTQLKAIGDIYFDGIYDSCSSLHDWLDAEGNPNSADVVLSMRWFFGKLRDKYSTSIGSYRIRLINTLQWINDNWPEDGDGIDMDAILAAMVAADPDEVTYFIGLEDAYRTALWDKPFNADFYAALARGFMHKWP